MDADQPLKKLFRLRARELLALTGDRGARVLSTGVLELPAVSRRVDTVLKLRRGRDVFLRHLEFQTRAPRGLAWRVFEYATRLVSHHRLPVLTTVMFLKPPAPSSLAHRESIGGRVVHERRFDVIRLWEMDPRQMLRLGPGAAALVGPMKRANLAVVARATRRILRTAPVEERSDLLAILQALSEGRYTRRQLARVIPREVVMGSSLFADARRMARREGRVEGRAVGRVEGRAEGALEEARRVCQALLTQRHPELTARLAPHIQACVDVSRLHRLILATPEVSAAELVALVTKPDASGPERTAKATLRRRVVRPARRSKRTRR